MSRFVAPLLFAALLVAGIAAGFLGRSTVQNPIGPPETFVFFDEQGEADFYASEQRNENLNHAIVITLITIGVLGLVVVASGRTHEATLEPS